MKKCNICLIEKNFAQFRKMIKCKGGFIPTCRHCENKKRRLKNSDRTILSNTLEYRKLASLKYRRNNFIQNMFHHAKSSAKKRNMEFDLTIEDLEIPEYCPYLNIKLTNNVGKGKTATNPSIDRIDNSKGYLKGNVQIISDLANSMKRECTIDQLIVFSQNVIKIHYQESL